MISALWLLLVRGCAPEVLAQRNSEFLEARFYWAAAAKPITGFKNTKPGLVDRAWDSYAMAETPRYGFLGVFTHGY